MSVVDSLKNTLSNSAINVRWSTLKNRRQKRGQRGAANKSPISQSSLRHADKSQGADDHCIACSMHSCADERELRPIRVLLMSKKKNILFACCALILPTYRPSPAARLRLTSSHPTLYAVCDVAPTSSQSQVRRVKERVEEKQGIPPEQQR